MSITMHPDEAVPGLRPDGRPDLAYAAALGLVPAPVGRRISAFALDAAGWLILSVPAVIGAAQLVPGVVEGSAEVSALVGPLVLVAIGQVLLTAYGLTQLALHGRRGVTAGKAALGLRSVDAISFAAPGFRRVALRALVLWASQLVLPIAGPALCFASGLWDPEGRGRSWLDRVGRCYAVDVRLGLDPADARALRHARRQLEAEPRAERAPLPSLASQRGVDDRTFIPAARSSSGVVAAPPASAPPVLPTAPAEPPAPAAVPRTGERPAVTLVFADGAHVVASGTTLIGRDPAVRDGDPADARLLPLHDATMELSKTHAAIVVGRHGLQVTDRWSRNGTEVVGADGHAVRLEPGVPHAVPTHASVRLGGVSFRVEAARA